MSKHTEGEWFYKRDGWSSIYIDCRIGGGMLQEVAVCGPTANGPEEQEANAQLLTAAPDLLDAAESTLKWWEQAKHETTGEHGEFNVFDSEPEFVIQARAAIAKARGEQ